MALHMGTGLPRAAVSLIVTGALAAVMLAGPPPAVAADPTNGPLLYSGSPVELKTDAGESTELDFTGFGLMEFSPDGAMIAVATTRCTDDACTGDQTTITVHGNDGSTTTLQPVPGFVSDLTWSSEQSQLGLLVSDGPDAEIWRLPVDGSAPVRVLGTTSSFRIEDEGLDWSPTAESIAFVGTPLRDDGSSLSINTGQLYTVGAEGGAPAKFSAQLPECEFPSCRLIEYSQPDWSPDGGQIAAYVDDETENFESDSRVVKEYLGRMARSQLPTVVVSIQTLDDPSSWTYLARQHPVWSADGSQILYAREVSGETVARTVTTTGGAVASVADPDYDDWQPCPAGECAPWGEVEDECTIEGTEGKDRLVGTEGDDVICGLGEADVLLGNGGSDLILGGDGQDDLVGGSGADVLQGDGGPDALRGDEGNDLLSGGTGIDLVTYSTSRRKVTVDLGRQRASSASHGNDRLLGVEGAFGSKSGDMLLGSSASNHLYGGPGADDLKGLGGADYLRGTAGEDELNGGRGGDLLEGEDGRDVLNGAGDRDACYDENARRVSCEVGGEKDPRGGKPPGEGPDSGEVGVPTAGGGALRAAGGLMYYWSIGNSDYLVVYNRVATANLGAWANATGWENQVCRFIRSAPPVRGACSAAGVLNAVSKYQMQWFLWNAKRNGGCAVGILDWGHHGVNQFKKRWKARSATYARYNVAIPWLDGDFTDVKTSNGNFRVRCV